MKCLGILGGSFDPIHNGHLFIANAAYQQLSLEAVVFVPCAQSPLKSSTQATNQQRLDMLNIALSNCTHFTTEPIELNRPPPSYTIDTFSHLKKRHPDTALCFIIGADALQSLTQWKQWETLFTLTHFIVAPRNAIPLPTAGKLGTQIQTNLVTDPKRFIQQEAGLVYELTMEDISLSATELRSKLSEGSNPQMFLPEGVYEYIHQHGLYNLS